MWLRDALESILSTILTVCRLPRKYATSSKQYCTSTTLVSEHAFET